jgi:PBP1b-binding outer membrane lipoprotein LpoB
MRKILLLSALASLSVSACETTKVNTTQLDNSRVDNSRGKATIYNDIREIGPVAGLGIESQDIDSMSDQMMRDILSTSGLGNKSNPPRVLIDEGDFKNNSSSRLNVALITNKLRVGLNRASQGSMIFTKRSGGVSSAVQRERALKRDGMTDDGTIRSTSAVAGADYVLHGEISSQDAVQSQDGLTSRYNQILFELYDAELQTIVWSNIYEFDKTSQNDVIYR